jgi:dGTPase
VEASRNLEEIQMSADVFSAMIATRDFLFERVYIGRVGAATQEAVERIVETLLEHYASGPGAAPPPRRPDRSDPRVRAVDYVAGMTDRFALRAFEDLVGAQGPSLGVLG